MAGCTASVGSSVEDPRTIAEHVQAQYDEIEQYETMVVRTVETGAATTTTRATVTVDTGTQARVEYHTGPNAGHTTVIDDPGAATLRAASSRAAVDGTPASFGALAADLVRANNVTYRGQATVHGREAAVLSVRPANGTDTGSAGAAGEDSDRPQLTEQRIWIDLDRAVPLRVRTTYAGGSGEVIETVRFTDISVTTGNATAPGGVAA